MVSLQNRSIFNSGKTIIIVILLIRDAHKKAFEDTWKFDDKHNNKRIRISLKNKARTDFKLMKSYIKLWKDADLLLQEKQGGYEGSIRAYLTFMAPRLAEMKRILKPTGNIFLHCDQSASSLSENVYG